MLITSPKLSFIGALLLADNETPRSITPADPLPIDAVTDLFPVLLYTSLVVSSCRFKMSMVSKRIYSPLSATWVADISQILTKRFLGHCCLLR